MSNVLRDKIVQELEERLARAEERANMLAKELKRESEFRKRADLEMKEAERQLKSALQEIEACECPCHDETPEDVSDPKNINVSKTTH